MKKRLFAMLLAVVTVATSINVTGIQARAAEDDGSAYVEVIDAESDSSEAIVLEEVSEEEIASLESEEAVEEDSAVEEVVEEDATTEETVEEDATTEEAVEEDATTEEAVEEEAIAEEVIDEIVEEEEDAVAEEAAEEEEYAVDLDESVETSDAATTQSAAGKITIGTAVSGTIQSARANTGRNEYWYKFTTGTKCVYYTLSYQSSSDDVYFYIQDVDNVAANGIRALAAKSDGTTAKAYYKLEPNTTYYVQVYTKKWDTNVDTYKFTVSMTDDAPDSMETAKTVNPSVKVEDSIVGKQYDEDWFKFRTNSSCVYYKLTFTSSDSDLDFYVLDEDGVRAAKVEPATASSKTVYLKLERNMTYYIRVVNGYSGSSVSEVMKYSFTYTPVSDAGGDQYTEAASIVAGQKYTENLACAADVDWYKFSGGAGSYTFEVNNSTAASHFRFELRNADDNQMFYLTPGSGSKGTKTITLPAGTYYIKVYCTWSASDMTLGGYNFKFTTTATANGLKQAQDGTWYYYQNGVVATSYSGMVQSGSAWYYVTNGVLKWGVNGLTNYNGTWFYIKNSTFDSSYSGLYNWQGNWYYITNGVLKWGVNGVASYGGKYYYVNNSQITWKDTGIVAFNGGYYYFQNSQFNASYSGLAQYGNDWYYVTNGVLKWGVNGCAQYGGKWYYVKNSKVDFSYTGYTTWGGKQYRVVNGVVQV